MAQQSVSVQLTGQSPLLMNAFPRVPLEAAEKKSPEEQAEHATYRDPGTGELYVPGVNIQRALVAAASYSKGKGRATLQRQAAACLMVSPERILINGGGVKDYVIDSRPVVVPATKGRVMRHRPTFDKWTLAFEIEYDDALLNAKDVRTIVDNMGTRVGILDFRPEKRGQFGRSTVTRWE